MREHWVFEAGSLTSAALTPAVEYRPLERSLAFPFLAPADVERFLHRFPGAAENRVMRARRACVRASPNA